jgi:cellulase/cellobiase CelA1
VRSLFVAVAGAWAVGCTQVHQLGQVEGSADSGEGATGSISSEASDGDLDSSSDIDTSSDTSDVDTETETETDDPEGGETGGPIPDACDIADLGGNEGVTIDIVLMTQWDAGACHEFHVTNETLDDVIWTRDLRFGGTLDNYWNAEGEPLNQTDWRFGGQASADNVVVLSGKTIIFGSCMLCTP